MEPKLRVAIVDDEELARGLLREMLGAHPEIEIAAECANGFDAVKAIAETRPDLVFLDIQMPKLDGFEALELIDPGPVVVFVTAYDEYAIRAFDAQAADYLLKPFGVERFERALERAKSRVGGRAHPAADRLPVLKRAAPPASGSRPRAKLLRFHETRCGAPGGAGGKFQPANGGRACAARRGLRRAGLWNGG